MASRAKPEPRNVLRFVVPLSLGQTVAAERGQRLEDYFTRALGQRMEIRVAPSYESLAKDLLSGRIDAAWAPPFVCARIESMGARVLVRGIRHGVSSYRGALVCHEDRRVTLQSLAGRRAMWVDSDSVAGFLLPTALLKSKGFDPAKLFFKQDFAGSYRAALEAVAEGRADVTSVFAPAAAPNAGERTGLEDIAPDLASRFEVIAFTDEAPNDGVAVTPAGSPENAARLQALLLSLNDTDEGKELLRDIFNAEAFEPAPRMGYRALYRVALATL